METRKRSGWRRGMLWSAVAVGVLIGLSGCGSSKSLAANIDDLLRAGKIGEANAKLAADLPDLVRNNKLDEIDDVASVLRDRTPALSPSNALSVQEQSASAYFAGVANELSDLPLDDLCEAVVTASSASSGATPSQTLTAYLAQRERQQRAAQYCQLLQLVS